MNCVLIESSSASTLATHKVAECRACGRPVEVPVAVDLRNTLRPCLIDTLPSCTHLGDKIGEVKVGCGGTKTPLHRCQLLTTKRGRPLSCTPLEVTMDYKIVPACPLCEHHTEL